MRPRVLLAAICAIAAIAVAASPAQAAPFHSDNVQLLGKLPEAAGAISARFQGDHMYVTTTNGLNVYDISQPESPKLVGALPLPHFENEDVDLGGDTLIISNDPSEGVGVLYVIDISDPTKPAIRSVMPNGLIGGLNQVFGLGESFTGHIANCLQGCDWLWLTGTSQGVVVVDLRDKDNPKFVKAFEMPAPKQRGTEVNPGDGGFTHDVFVDRSGVAWITGQDGTFGYDAADPVNPKLVYRSDENVFNSGQDGPSGDGSNPIDFLHHNSIRTGLFADRKTKPQRSSTRGGLGDVVAVTEEDYTRPTCQGQGSLQTWQITSDRNSDGTRKLKMLDMWTTELNELANQTGRSPATGLCSAHWFDEDRGLLAQGWYDQGVRFMDISNPRDIRQVGYWVTTGTFWAAYFAPTDPDRQVVYGLDLTGGVDVLKIDRGVEGDPTGSPSVKAPVLDRWFTSGPVAGTASSKWGFVCRVPSLQ
jgi:hypothetical protein